MNGAQEADCKMAYDRDVNVDPRQLKALEALVATLRNNPEMAHSPELSSFKDLILGWGATIPGTPPPTTDEGAAPAEVRARDANAQEQAHGAEEQPAQPAAPKKPEDPEEAEEPEEPEEPEELEEPEEPEEPVEPEEPEEEEDPERLPEDPAPYPELGPVEEAGLPEEQAEARAEAQAKAKEAAAEALEEGRLEQALEFYTQAIKAGGATAMLYARRAALLMKLKRPNACIADCNAALGVNPDSGKAYRLRGQAHRRLGHWEEAHGDLSMGQRLDYDDEAADVQKFVDERWHKISERRTRKRVREENLAKRKLEREVKRRRAAAKKAYKEAKAK